MEHSFNPRLRVRHASAGLLTLWVSFFAPAYGEEKPPAVPPPAAGQTTALPITDALVTGLNTPPVLGGQGDPRAVELRSPALKVQRRGTTNLEDAKIGTRVRPQDTLITDDATSAQVQLMDGSLLVLGPNTRLLFSDRTMTPRGVRTLLTLYHGLVRMRVSPVAHAGGFALATTQMQMQTEIPSSVIVRHREAREIGKRGCTLVTLITGHVQAMGVSAGSGPKVLVKDGEQAHFCDMDHLEKILALLPEEELNRLKGSIPFYNGEEPHPDDLPLPNPSLPDTPAVGATPGFPGVPGIIVAPPRIIGDTPFEFTPGLPEDLTPVHDISP